MTQQARFQPMICSARFLVEELADPVQNDRMKCSLTEGHEGRHRNASHDLGWQTGAEISVRSALVARLAEARAVQG